MAGARILYRQEERVRRRKGVHQYSLVARKLAVPSDLLGAVAEPSAARRRWPGPTSRNSFGLCFSLNAPRFNRAAVNLAGVDAPAGRGHFTRKFLNTRRTRVGVILSLRWVSPQGRRRAAGRHRQGGRFEVRGRILLWHPTDFIVADASWHSALLTTRTTACPTRTGPASMGSTGRSSARRYALHARDGRPHADLHGLARGDQHQHPAQRDALPPLSAAGQSLPGAMCLLVATVATSILFLTDQALVVYLSATAFCACIAHIALVSARQLLIGAGRARRAAPLVPAPASRRRVRPRAHRRAGR